MDEAKVQQHIVSQKLNTTSLAPLPAIQPTPNCCALVGASPPPDPCLSWTFWFTPSPFRSPNCIINYKHPTRAVLFSLSITPSPFRSLTRITNIQHVPYSSLFLSSHHLFDHQMYYKRPTRAVLFSLSITPSPFWSLKCMQASLDEVPTCQTHPLAL